MLTALAGDTNYCSSKLACIAIEARAELPPTLFGRYAFGIVRRGVIVRERLDTNGARIAVDAAGRGAYVPLGRARGYAGYAACRTLLCVYREPNLDSMNGRGDLGMDLMTLASETLDRVERIADARGRSTARERVDALCSTLQECLGPHAFEQLLQRDLAALLGMRTETVCRVLRARDSRG
jgi:hypothetical protein